VVFYILIPINLSLLFHPLIGIERLLDERTACPWTKSFAYVPVIVHFPYLLIQEPIVKKQKIFQVLQILQALCGAAVQERLRPRPRLRRRGHAACLLLRW
jgi:hypothetical protein